MRLLLATTLFCSALFGVEQGELRFSVGGKTYTTSNAQGVLLLKAKKSRIHIAVKDVSQRFLFMVTADVEPGREKEPLFLTSEDTELSVSLRTSRGVLAILPEVQLAKVDPQLVYIERKDVETGETEEVVNGQSGDKHSEQKRLNRRKIRSEYERKTPRWHQMSRSERLKSGSGVIRNEAFRNTFFAIRLVPILAAGKVIAYNGTFSGTGRFSNSIQGGEIRAIEGGEFHVKVENVR